MKAKYLGEGAYHYGIPARNLSSDDWERLTPEQQTIVKSSPLYEMVGNKKAKAEAKED